MDVRFNMYEILEFIESMIELGFEDDEDLTYYHVLLNECELPKWKIKEYRQRIQEWKETVF